MDATTKIALSPDLLAKLERIVPPPPPQGSYVRNCLWQAREHEYLFSINLDGEWIASLDGYAIIPIEEYEKITGLQVPRPSATA